MSHSVPDTESKIPLAPFNEEGKSNSGFFPFFKWSFGKAGWGFE
jgi:hypothetical protein